ncbi:MAG: BMP family ABC transporter substrate-binding protein [Spirochaetaceae bacterium]|nr:MAG: BMP family ABC transporter substrate-binding protein [Spirochaetaceae bacterium]
MKRILILVIAGLVLIGSLSFAGGRQEAASDSTRVLLYLNGTRGDQSFFDSASRGITIAAEQFDIETRIVEGGYDSSAWQPDLAQLAGGGWDILIAGTWQLAEYVQDLAVQYPDTTFIVYDTAVDYSAGDFSNVYSILYSQNEGSFLAGALAGMLTASDLDLSRSGNTVGFIGGMDIPVINDFRVGFEQGARQVNPEVRVLAAYVGNFNDPARGKELALAQIEQGADVIFAAAGESGLGALEAAGEQGVYSIGVDSDQYLLLRDNQPNIAASVVTSMLKNVDNSMLRAIERYLDGTLAIGQAEVLGIREEGVGIARNENFDRIVPQAMVDELDRLIDMIDSGEIVVETAIGE